jgi:addiction module RelE/StbE family toxin
MLVRTKKRHTDEETVSVCFQVHPENVEKIRAFVAKLAPATVQRYEKWKDIVKISGPQGLKLIRGFHDEALSGNWKDFRSSRLNIQYRAIYKVLKDQVLVEVERVTPHDYRR